MFVRSCVVRACLALFTAVALWGSAQTPGVEPTRVLFIGNSLTTANDLPGLIEAMSSSVGAPLRCEKVTFDGFSLEDHWNEGSARRAIAKGGWSTVVLQQGPSALPESRVLLIEYVRRFDTEVRRAGARTAL